MVTTILIDEVVMIGVVAVAAVADHVVEIPLFARMIDGRNRTSVTMPNMAENGKWTQRAAAPENEVEKVSNAGNGTRKY